MRLSKFCVASTFAVCLAAQTPIGMGPAGLVQWQQFPLVGDTVYGSLWMSAADCAANCPVTTGLPIYGTGNDTLANIRMFQLDAFDWANPATLHTTTVNMMTGYGTADATNSPAGWLAHCTFPDSSDCSWKSREPLARGGCIHWPVERQIASGTPSPHDATIIRSCDAGKTWKNPYTIATSGSADANGDAPKPSPDASYPGSIMWVMPAIIGQYIYNWNFIQYGQDGSLPTVPGGCDPSIWACATLGDGSLGRAPNASIEDVTTWQYYAGRIANGVIPSGNDPANWVPLFYTTSATSFTPSTGSKTFVVPAGLSGLDLGRFAYVTSAGTVAKMNGVITTYSGTSLTINVTEYDAHGAGAGAHTDWQITTRSSVMELGGILGGNGDSVRCWGVLSAPAYLKEFKSYLLACFYIWPSGMYSVGFMAAPQPWGPWETIYIHNADPAGHGFPAISLAVGYTVVSTNPPKVRVACVVNGSDREFIQQWEFVVGRQPYGSGELANYTDIGIKKLNSGWVFGAGDVPGTFNRKGLVWAFDFMDHGGDVNAKYPYFRDVAGNGGLLQSCYTNGAVICGVTGTGVVLNADSVTTGGYSGRLELRASITSNGGSSSNAVLPSCLTGNKDWAVAYVFRKNVADSSTPLYMGDETGSNTSVGMTIGSPGLGFQWGFLSSGSAMHGSWLPTLNNWYFVLATQKANGATPVMHAWVGIGGQLVDVLLYGTVTNRTQFGSGNATPNISAAGTFLVNQAATTGGTYPSGGNYSHAALIPYCRAFTLADAQQMYTTFKTKMAERGITLQ